MCVLIFFFLMIRRPPRSTRTYTLFPYTTLFRSLAGRPVRVVAPFLAGRLARLGGNPNASPHRLCRAALYLCRWRPRQLRSEEHTSELQSLMRISYAVFCLKKKKTKQYNVNIELPFRQRIKK